MVEALLGRSLTHPHIVTVYALGVSEQEVRAGLEVDPEVACMSWLPHALNRTPSARPDCHLCALTPWLCCPASCACRRLAPIMCTSKCGSCRVRLGPQVMIRTPAWLPGVFASCQALLPAIAASTSGSGSRVRCTHQVETLHCAPHDPAEYCNRGSLLDAIDRGVLHAKTGEGGPNLQAIVACAQEVAGELSALCLCCCAAFPGGRR